MSEQGDGKKNGTKEGIGVRKEREGRELTAHIRPIKATETRLRYLLGAESDCRRSRLQVQSSHSNQTAKNQSRSKERTWSQMPTCPSSE